MNTRNFTSEDLPALQAAIDKDIGHQGMWKVEYFIHPSVHSEVIEDSQGPVTFTLFERASRTQLRVSCVWVDATDTSRNARAIIFGVKDAIAKARSGGYAEILIESEHPPLRNFLETFLGFSPKAESKDMSLVL